MDPDQEIEFEALSYIRIYKSGRVERFCGTEFVPPSLDPLTGVLSKDVTISLETGVSVRLYRPKLLDSSKRLPVLVYFHGGGFCLGRPFNPMFHNIINSLVAQSNAIAVSVDYRLAPEHPIPTPYHDSWGALKWVASQVFSDDDKWLAEHADFQKIILAGDSAGGNIAHHMAMRANTDRLEGGAVIGGLILIHPYFLGSNSVESENIDLDMSKGIDTLWRMACPSTVMGVDDHWINPLAVDAPSLSGLACERALVCVAGEDVLRDRGRDYFERLRGSSGWRGVVEMLESEGEGHVFHAFKPTCDKAVELNKKICDFINLNN